MDVEAASELGSDTSPVLAGSVGALPDAKPALASHMVQLACNLSYILHPCGASSFMEDSSAVWHLKRSRLHAGAPLVGFETLTWAPSSRAEHFDPSLRGRLPQARSFRRRMPK